MLKADVCLCRWMRPYFLFLHVKVMCWRSLLQTAFTLCAQHQEDGNMEGWSPHILLRYFLSRATVTCLQRPKPESDDLVEKTGQNIVFWWGEFCRTRVQFIRDTAHITWTRSIITSRKTKGKAGRCLRLFALPNKTTESQRIPSPRVQLQWSLLWTSDWQCRPCRLRLKRNAWSMSDVMNSPKKCLSFWVTSQYSMQTIIPHLKHERRPVLSANFTNEGAWRAWLWCIFKWSSQFWHLQNILPIFLNDPIAFRAGDSWHKPLASSELKSSPKTAEPTQPSIHFEHTQPLASCKVQHPKGPSPCPSLCWHARATPQVVSKLRPQTTRFPSTF